MSEKREIAVLAIDNGEYTAYVGYFDSPARLKAAVGKLNEERLDRNTDEPAEAEYRVETVEVVPDIIDDAFLDRLARMLEDAGADIESADDRKQRLAQQAADEEEPEPFVPSPGQMELPG